MEATGSNPVEPTNMDKGPETDKQLQLPEGKPSGAENPLAKADPLRPPSSIVMSVEDGMRKVKIVPSMDPEKNFAVIDSKTGKEIELTDKNDIANATNLIRSNPFRRR